MRNDPYRGTVAELIDPHVKFKPAALAALRLFRRSRPWRGSVDERHQKFRLLHEALCQVYSLTPQPRLIFGNDHVSCSGRSCFIPSMNVVILRGRLSVTTYLHELAHCRGMNERGAVAFSINLFRRVWPQQFARCTHDRHMLRAPLPSGGEER